MSTEPTPAPPAAGKPQGLAALVPHRRQITITLFALGAALLAIPIVNVIRYRFDEIEVFLWGLCLSLSVLVTGLFAAVLPPADAKTEEDRLRLQFLSLGSVCGLATVLLGLVVPPTRFWEVIKAGQKAWREHAWPLTGCAVAVIVGLGLIFASLQLARPAQRSNPTMRRLLYGYNAALSGFLLLIILGLCNVLGYFVFKTPFDWTASGIYTLSTSTRNFLTDLKKPVKVYILLSRNDRITQDMLTLLENARGLTSEISWELLPPDRPESYREIQKLRQKYPTMPEEGLLVTYGIEPNLSWDFIKTPDLEEEQQPSRRDERPRYTFKGEGALMKSLLYLSEGKARALVYFTQGSGELPLQPEGGLRRGNDLSVLRDRLGMANYEVKELELGLKTPGVPKDADVVVVARPTRPMAAEALKALRDYMGGAGGKKGTLIVLLDVVVRPDGGMVQTGLEGMLREYHVQVGNDRILQLANPRNPTAVIAICNPNSANPIAQAFAGDGRTIPTFAFEDARSVSPLPGNPRDRSSAAADVLLRVPRELGLIVEKDLSADPRALVLSLIRSGSRERIMEKVSQQSVSVAVTVAESSGGLPRVPGHERFLKERPRLVVFGASDWLTSANLNGPRGRSSTSLFTSCLSWLRGRADIGEKATEGGKARQSYMLGVMPDTVTRIIVLPLVLMVLIVVGLGGGVWVVRRR